jgi:stress response protein YsnF
MAINENDNEENRLEELGGSDFEIVDGQPDIKGWEVKDAIGGDLGEVDELIFDRVSRKVRYIVVDLDENDLNLKSRKVLVPIGLVTLDEDDKEVVLPESEARHLYALPEYEKGRITPALESGIRNTLTGLGLAAAGTAAYDQHPEGFYDHKHFDDTRFYAGRTNSDAVNIPIIEEELNVGKREVETGGVAVTSKIIETPVSESITLKEEQVHVTREAIDRPATTADFETFKEGKTVLIETKEVPVISKIATVVEEVSVRKEVGERKEVIKETVRKTEVDIEDIDKDKPDTAYNAL